MVKAFDHQSGAYALQRMPAMHMVKSHWVTSLGLKAYKMHHDYIELQRAIAASTNDQASIALLPDLFDVHYMIHWLETFGV